MTISARDEFKHRMQCLVGETFSESDRIIVAHIAMTQAQTEAVIAMLDAANSLTSYTDAEIAAEYRRRASAVQPLNMADFANGLLRGPKP